MSAKISLLLSITAIGVSIYAVYKIKKETQLSSEILELITDVSTELSFAGLVERYEDDED